MPRPKRPFNGQETIQTVTPAWMGAELGVRQRQRFDSSTHWAHRMANGLYDPLTYLLVLDTVANIDPNIELRAKALTEWLNLQRKQFLWDPVTVGKVLADIAEQFNAVLGEANPFLPRGRDYRGAFYLIRRSEQAQALFVAVHEQLADLAQEEINLRAIHRPPQRLVSPLSEVAALRGEWVDA